MRFSDWVSWWAYEGHPAAEKFCTRISPWDEWPWHQIACSSERHWPGRTSSVWPIFVEWDTKTFTPITRSISHLEDACQSVRLCHQDQVSRDQLIRVQLEILAGNNVSDMACFVSSESVIFSFSSLMLLVGWQEGHLACKNWVVRYWLGYLSGARCKWFAYGPADATATPSSLASVKSRMVLPLWCWRIQVVVEKGH